MPTNQRTANVADRTVTHAQVTAAIYAYLRAYEASAPSVMGSVVDYATRGAQIQCSPDPEGALGRWDPWALRDLVEEELRVLRTIYLPSRPTLVVTGHDRQTGFGIVRVTRVTLEVAARRLGLRVREVSRLHGSAREKVRRQLERMQGDER